MFCVPICGSMCVLCAEPRGPELTPSASVQKWTARTAPCTLSPDADNRWQVPNKAQKAESSECDFYFILLFNSTRFFVALVWFGSLLFNNLCTFVV